MRLKDRFKQRASVLQARAHGADRDREPRRDLFVVETENRAQAQRTGDARRQRVDRGLERGLELALLGFTVRVAALRGIVDVARVRGVTLVAIAAQEPTTFVQRRSEHETEQHATRVVGQEAAPPQASQRFRDGVPGEIVAGQHAACTAQETGEVRRDTGVERFAGKHFACRGHRSQGTVTVRRVDGSTRRGGRDLPRPPSRPGPVRCARGDLQAKGALGGECFGA